MLTYVIYTIALLSALAAVLLQLKRDLMLLQQNSYRNERYRRWASEAKESTTYSRLFGYLAFFLALVPSIPGVLSSVFIAIFGLWCAAGLLMAKYKKPLVFTKRATRIYIVSIMLVVIVALVPLAINPTEQGLRMAGAMLVLCYSASYLFTLASNWLLQPVETAINKKYYNEAAGMLASMPNLKIIGVTGSYGKTSTKHYLSRILSEQYDVLMTPGNFNTTLGVIRTVRENMKPYNEIFIVEMGAKQRGDIKEICDLVHPHIGIITAVGPMHLDTFKNIEGVQATKFELVDALPADGLAIVNNDFEYTANRPVDNCVCLRYTAEDKADTDFKAANIKYSSDGTCFDIVDKDGEKVISLHTRLVGRCNVSNLIAAVVVALHLGMDEQKIRYAVEKIEQVEHRLSIKRLPTGITLIDDAYNSNPVGSGMALEVLSQMPGQRIIITPGMIELGDDQQELNRQLGASIANSVDVAIIVGEYNREAIMEGIDSVDNKKLKTYKTASFDEAQKLMLSIAKRGDTVLYENDLPDTFK